MSTSQQPPPGAEPVLWDGFDQYNRRHPMAYGLPPALEAAGAECVLSALLDGRASYRADSSRAAGDVQAQKVRKADRAAWYADHGPTAEAVSPAAHRQPLAWARCAPIDGHDRAPAYPPDRPPLPRGVYAQLGPFATVSVWAVDRYGRVIGSASMPDDAELVAGQVRLYWGALPRIERIPPEPSVWEKACYDPGDTDDDNDLENSGEEWKK